MTMSRSSASTPKKDPVRGTWGWMFESVHPRPDGSRRQIHRRGFVTKTAAQAALDRARREDMALIASDGGLTVKDVFDDFVRTKKLAGRAPNTIAQYEWAAGLAAQRWGGWPAQKLTAELLDAAYLTMLAGGRRQFRRGQGTTTTDKPMSRRSVEAFHKATKAAFQLAVDRGKLPRNPAALATPPAVVEQDRRWWTPQQVGQFLHYLSNEQPCVTVGLGETLVDVAGRRGEVLGLRWADIDLELGTATVVQQLVAHPTTKALSLRPTKRPRSKSVIGLHPDTLVALRRRKGEQAEDRLQMGRGWPRADSIHHALVFTWPDGRAIHPDVLTRTVERLSVAAGLPRLTPHGFRHSFATAALKSRVPVEVVAARLGNTARVVQEVYQHVIPADDAAAAQLIGDLYRGRRPS
jgi:integrase